MSFWSDYNFQVVLLGCVCLGLAAGIIGPFMLLRKRALLADVVSHATLPGICISVSILMAFGASSRNLFFVLGGALISGLMGIWAVMAIQKYTRLKQDAALGIVLSTFYGLGIAIMGMLQKQGDSLTAGLNHFIYGKTASMIAQDAKIMSLAAVVVILITLVAYKELKLLCFDKSYGQSQGLPMEFMDRLTMILVVFITVIGLQAVGLILIIAMLIMPAAAARFWSRKLPKVIIYSSLIGAISAAAGVTVSALVPKLPPGAIIVLSAFSIFLFSMLFGPINGFFHILIMQYRRKKRMLNDHLLRAMFEYLEQHPAAQDVPKTFLLKIRAWSKTQFAGVLSYAKKKNHAIENSSGNYVFTREGAGLALRLVKQHRLWELYLIHHADIPPSHVDRDADAVEHVLDDQQIEALENLLEEKGKLPPSPHLLNRGGA